ncbi:MAG: carbohydrate-binding protein, partial [Verrucomicrobiota bacterium]
PVPNFDFENRNNPENDATPDEQSDGWHKVYRNGDTSSWTWQASNQDFDALALFWNLQAGETYSLQISARSVGHAIDRVTLWNRDTQNRANKVSGATNNNQNNRFDSRALSQFVPTVQQAFNTGNVPWALPTRIEAEDFDIGGQGTSYNDTDAGNRGNSPYRSGEDVDIGTTNDGGNALKVNWTADGEWLEYTVNPNAAQYELQVRVASADANPGSLRLTLDGVLLTEVDVASTGDWSIWETLTSSSFSLNSGEQVLRVEIVGGNFDLNWFEFVEVTPAQGTFGNNGNPWALPGSIEAENFDTGGQGISYFDSDAGNTGNSPYRDGEDVDLGTTTDNGSAIKLNWTVDGEWVEYTVDPAVTQYELQVRVASDAANPGSLRVTLDGELLTEVDVNPTGGWSTWETLTSSPFLLGSGVKVLRVEIVGGNFDINRFDFVETATPQVTFGNSGSAWALPGTIEAEDFDTGGENVAYFDTSAGNNGDSNYRSGTNVDVRTSSSSTSGLAIGWNTDTEWLEYTISPQAGFYDLILSAASASNSPGEVRFLIDGQTITTINVTTTGGWDTFQPFAATGIPLNAGHQVLRVEIVGGSLDIDRFVFEFQQNFMGAQRSQFGMASDGSDDTADDSGNGVENILYLLFNMGDPSGLMTPPFTVSEGDVTPGLPAIWKNEVNGQITYSFLWPLSSGGYVADLQVSSDLVTWTSSGNLPVDERPTLETQPYDSDYVIYNYTFPSSSEEAFIRLNITNGASY